MKDIHIIFNIDYKDKSSQIHFFRESLVRQIAENVIELPNFSQFKTLLSSLEENIKCYIWVHPSLGSEIVAEGYESDVMKKVVPELTVLGIEYREITRTANLPLNASRVHVNAMPNEIKAMRSYTSKELKDIVFNNSTNFQTQVKKRKRLEDDYLTDINSINENFISLKKLLARRYRKDSNWDKTVLQLSDGELPQEYKTKFWKFSSEIFFTFLNLEDIDSPVLDNSTLDVNQGIIFSPSTKQWQIGYSFFDQVSQRFETLSEDYRADVLVATDLFIIHELIHKIHNLDSNTVEGIGNYPRIVEDVDYQADAIAILTEVVFFIESKGGLDSISPMQIIDRVLAVIKIAIETTFSFNPISIETGLIQIRRVNRYLTWIFHYIQIENSKLQKSKAKETLINICNLVSSKPIIELAGPAIRSNAANDRTFYDLNSIAHIEGVSFINRNNQIIRIGKTENVKFSTLYEGFRNSDFKGVYDFLKSVILLNKHSL